MRKNSGGRPNGASLDSADRVYAGNAMNCAPPDCINYAAVQRVATAENIYLVNIKVLLLSTRTSDFSHEADLPAYIRAGRAPRSSLSSSKVVLVTQRPDCLWLSNVGISFSQRTPTRESVYVLEFSDKYNLSVSLP